MGLVLEDASCTSVYKQAPETTLFNGGLVVYVFDFGAFSRFFTSAYK